MVVPRPFLEEVEVEVLLPFQVKGAVAVPQPFLEEVEGEARHPFPVEEEEEEEEGVFHPLLEEAVVEELPQFLEEVVVARQPFQAEKEEVVLHSFLEEEEEESHLFLSQGAEEGAEEWLRLLQKEE